MIVKIFHEYLSQSRPSNLQEDLQKLEDKINTFAGQKGVVIHDIKYEKIQNGQTSKNYTTLSLSPRRTGKRLMSRYATFIIFI